MGEIDKYAFWKNILGEKPLPPIPETDATPILQMRRDVQVLLAEMRVVFSCDDTIHTNEHTTARVAALQMGDKLIKAIRGLDNATSSEQQFQNECLRIMATYRPQVAVQPGVFNQVLACIENFIRQWTGIQFSDSLVPKTPLHGIFSAGKN